MPSIRGTSPFKKYMEVKDTYDKYDRECVRLNQQLIKWEEEAEICKKRFFNNPFCRSVTEEKLRKLVPLHAEKIKLRFVGGKTPIFMLSGLWETNTDYIAADMNTIELLKAYKNKFISEAYLERLANCRFFNSQPDWLVEELATVQKELIATMKHAKEEQARKDVSKHLQDWLTGIRDNGYTITDEEKSLLEEMGVIVNPEKLEGNRKER